ARSAASISPCSRSSSARAASSERFSISAVGSAPSVIAPPPPRPSPQGGGCRSVHLAMSRQMHWGTPPPLWGRLGGGCCQLPMFDCSRDLRDQLAGRGPRFLRHLGARQHPGQLLAAGLEVEAADVGADEGPLLHRLLLDQQMAP